MICRVWCMSYQVWYLLHAMLYRFMPIFLTCYTPNLMYLVSSFVCDVLKLLLKTLSCDVNFNTSCMIIGSGIFKFVHVASPVIYAMLRLPLLLYRLFSFLAYQLPYVACKPNKFMLYQDLSAAPLFFRHPIQWEIIITCRSLMILNYKAQKLTMVFSSCQSQC